MDYRAFDMNLASLEGLKSQKYSLFKTRFYAVVSVVATSISRQNSPLGKLHEGGKVHKWNYPMKFYADESELQQNSVVLMIQLWRRRAFCEDKEVGEVYVPLKSLYDKSISQNDAVTNSCPSSNINDNLGVYRVVTTSRTYKGYLCFSFTFSDVFRGTVRRSSGEGSPMLQRSVARRYSVAPWAPYIGTNPDNEICC